MISEPPPGRQFVILARAAPTEPGAMARVRITAAEANSLAGEVLGPERAGPAAAAPDTPEANERAFV